MNREKKYYTQWAGQFFTAAELTRRKYMVSFTMGNAPKTDILVESSNGRTFKVECKSLGSNNFWLFGKVFPEPNLYFVFIRVPADETEKFRAFIMTSEEVADEWNKYHENHPSDKMTGINWTTPHRYEDKWDKLPT